MNGPQQITVHAASGRMSLTWDDGHTQSIDNTTLRERCPCSTCRRLAHAGEARLDSPRVAIVDMQPMGYGMQIVFSDGHAQGIYPWDYLKQID